ncbi:hypothetical protein [Xanthomonas phage JGB6]|nr:hypothetical protein [Xanthomonas phage JGB6]
MMGIISGEIEDDLEITPQELVDLDVALGGLSDRVLTARRAVA